MSYGTVKKQRTCLEGGAKDAELDKGHDLVEQERETGATDLAGQLSKTAYDAIASSVRILRFLFSSITMSFLLRRAALPQVRHSFALLPI